MWRNRAVTKNIEAQKLLEKIFHYMNLLVIEKDFHKSIILLTELGQTLVGAERTSFWYKDEKKKQYWTIAAVGEQKIEVPAGSGIVGYSIENNETVLISEPYDDFRFNPEVDRETGYKTKSILCMPVTNSAGEVIGAYQAINKLNDKKFDEQDVRYLALAAGYSGKILETQLLKEQNQIDPLTGLKNRRGFFNLYDNSLVQIIPEERSSIIMCDIDFFKKVNDTYGHNVGDSVLVHISDLLNKAVGNSGQVFRWGGEEFVILLPEAGRDDALKLAEHYRKQVEESEFYSDNRIIKVTMSFGVFQLQADKASSENIKEVDDNLYKAKGQGRNKVIG